MTAERTDRELLELAAKAAGYKYHSPAGYIVVDGIPGNWNPLEDDADALRLAVDLGVVFDPTRGKTFAGTTQYDAVEGHGGDPYAATRRAIVRAASQISLGMEDHNGMA